MVTVQEALTQVQQSEEAASQRETELGRAETRARRIRVGGTVAEQFKFGTAQGLTEARRVATQQRQRALAEIETAREELSGFRQALVGRRGQIAEVQAQQQEASAFNRDLAIARKLAGKGASGSIAASQESKRIQRLVSQIQEGRRVVRRGGSETPEGLAGFSTPRGEGFVDISSGEIFTPVASAIGGGVLVEGERPAVAQFQTLEAPVFQTLELQQSQVATSPTPSRSGFGGIDIQPSDTSLRTFIKRRNPVTGTLQFVVEKGRAKLGKLEERFTPRGQKLAGGITGERTSSVVQIAPFIIPITAPASLILSGAGQFTPGGIREAEDIAVGLEQRFGIPQTIGKAGVLGLAGTGVAIGAVGVLGQIRGALELPKFDVRFIAGQKPTTKLTVVGEDTFVSTKGVADVTKQGLIFDRTKQFVFESLSKVTSKGDEFSFQTATRGAGLQPTQRSLDIVTGAVRKKPPELTKDTFGVLTGGIGRRGEQAVRLDLPQIGGEATKTVEGFEFVGSSKLFKKGIDFEQSISIGKGFQIGEKTLVTTGKTAPFEFNVALGGSESRALGRVGRTNVFGVTKLTPETDASLSNIILKTRLGKTDIAKSISEQTTKGALAQAFPVSRVESLAPKITSALGGTQSLAPQSTVTSISPQTFIQQPITLRPRSQFEGTGLFERTTDTASLISLTRPSKATGFSFSTANLQSSFQGLGSSLLSKQEPLQRSGLRNLSALIQPQTQPTRQRGLQSQAQAQRLLQRQVQRQAFRAPSPTDLFPPAFAGGGFGGLTTLFPRREKKREGKKKAVRAARDFGISVSFTASALGLTGKFPVIKSPGLGLTPEQFRLIPERRRKRKG